MARAKCFLEVGQRLMACTHFDAVNTVSVCGKAVANVATDAVKCQNIPSLVSFARLRMQYRNSAPMGPPPAAIVLFPDANLQRYQ